MLNSTGDEYEDANNMPIDGTDGTKCPPSREVPSVKAKCWTWSAKGLGHGTFTQANPSFQPDNFTDTFTGGTGKFRGVSGTLTGDGQTVVLSVDPATGIAHKRGTSTESGTLTFPRKL